MKKLSLITFLFFTLSSCDFTTASSHLSIEEQRVKDSIENAEERIRYLGTAIDENSTTSTKTNQYVKSESIKPVSKIHIIGFGDYASKLKNRLGYLGELEEVDWVEIDNNTVYIGLNTRVDMAIICNGAAFHGNNEINFGCHVWAIDSKKYKNSTSANLNSMFETTCRNGKFE